MILDQFRLDGKRAVVTGASAGLGKGMALGLAEAGADLVIIARSSLLGQTKSDIEKLGRKCLAIPADLADGDKIPGLVQRILKETGKIDILVNNAGIVRRAPAVDHSLEDWDEVMNLNVRSMFLLSREVGRQMIANRSGKIINIASMLSFSGGITVPSYSASKGAVGQLTKALANEWASRGINVNAIAPGYMETDNTDALRKNAKRCEEITARIPCGRWGKPEDMKGAVVFLASEASAYLHGQILLVDGGWMAR